MKQENVDNVLGALCIGVAAYFFITWISGGIFSKSISEFTLKDIGIIILDIIILLNVINIVIRAFFPKD